MHDQLDLIWKETLDFVKTKLNAPTFKTWFENTAPLTIYENTFLVSAPNSFTKEWLEKRYALLLGQALHKVTGEEMRVKFTTQEKIKEGGEGPRTEPPVSAPRAVQNDPTLNPKYTFDSFVVGAGNRFAQAAALAVAERPSRQYNPLFIYGGVGLGKTHLLQAIGQYVLKHFPDLKVQYVSTEKFTNDFINSIRDKDKIVGFQRRYRHNDVLLIDDIHFLENKEATQEEFFHTFNTLHQADKQIVITSDRPPKDLATLEDRLKSRFEWGLITDITPPDLETRIAILRKKSQWEKLEVPNEILELVASRIQSNIRELEGALTRILAFSSLTKSEIDLDLAKDVLKDTFPEKESRPVTVQTIQQEVCRYFRLPKTELVGTKRSQSIVYPRQIAMYLTRELTDLSLPKIGEEFGKRDHTTVIHANTKIEKLMNEQHEVYHQIRELINRIKNRVN
ncbi:MAG TPA: chromosomal replication initiator protein DnaA [Candidatus Subteraquimicrobiales bacterium]